MSLESHLLLTIGPSRVAIVSCANAKGIFCQQIGKDSRELDNQIQFQCLIIVLVWPGCQEGKGSQGDGMAQLDNVSPQQAHRHNYHRQSSTLQLRMVLNLNILQDQIVVRQLRF